MTSPVSAVEAIEKARLVIRVAGPLTAYAYTEAGDDGDYMTVEDAKSIVAILARKAEALERRAEEAEALAERIKLEAQAHAQEARTANSTIYEIYQVVSGGKGEPGNWHGAEPVREKLEALGRENVEKDARITALTTGLTPFARIADMTRDNATGTSVMVNVDRCRDACAVLGVSKNAE